MGFTSYVDDIRLRSERGSIGQQEDTLEAGFHAIEVFMRETGFSLSPEKATYVVLANKHNDHQGVKDLICLALQGKRMQDQPSVRGFGVVIDEDHAAPSWFNHLSKTWINTLNLIRQVSLKSWGAEE